MRIIGIDPGFGRTGYGIIDAQGSSYQVVEYGCIETVPHTPVGERLKEIYLTVSHLLETYLPQEMAIEQLFFNRNVTTAFTASEARGVVVLAAELHQILQAHYTPLQVKQAVVGYGRAEKKQVQEMVRVLLSLRELPKPDDAADALAVAIAHAQASQVNRRLARLEAAVSREKGKR